MKRRRHFQNPNSLESAVQDVIGLRMLVQALERDNLHHAALRLALDQLPQIERKLTRVCERLRGHIGGVYGN